MEQLREELQKEKKVIEQQGEVVNGLVNGDLPACHTKIADLEAALRLERSERESEATCIRETVAKNREDLAESLEKDRAEVRDRMEEDAQKAVRKLGEETAALKTAIEKEAQERKEEAATLSARIDEEAKKISSNLEEECKTLKSLAESCGEKALREVAVVKDSSKEEVANVREEVEKGREELEKRIEGREQEMQSLVQSGRQGSYSVLYCDEFQATDVRSPTTLLLISCWLT